MSLEEDVPPGSLLDPGMPPAMSGPVTGIGSKPTQVGLAGSDHADDLEESLPPTGLADLRLGAERRELRLIKRERDRRVDRVRAMIGGFLLAMLAFCVVAPWISIWADIDYFDEAKELFPLVTTPLIGLIGAAMGFYFGERSSDDDPPSRQQGRN